MRKKTIVSLMGMMLVVLVYLLNWNMDAYAADIYDVQVQVQYGQTEAREMLDMINEFRTGDEAWAWNSTDSAKNYYSNLQELVYDYRLEEIAMQRAAEIAIMYSHTRPNGSSCFSLYTNYKAGGENIAAGYTTASSVFEGWREDNESYAGQGHRRNMLNGSFTHVGIGHVYYNGIHYWVQEFAAPSSYGADHDATAPADSLKSVTIPISSNNIQQTKFTYAENSLKLLRGDIQSLPELKIEILTPYSWPGYYCEVTVPYTWICSDPSIASISNGRITGVKEGSTFVTANAFNQSASIPVEVRELDSVTNIQSSVTNNRITLQWDEVDQATGYIIYRKNSGSWVQIASVTENTYSNGGLKSGVNYEYRICAYADIASGRLISARTAEISAVTMLDKVSISSSSSTDNSVTISWKAVSGADGYVIYRKNSGKWTRIKMVADTTYTNGGLTSGTTYEYAVRAYKMEDGREILSYGYPTVSVVTMLPRITSFTYSSTDTKATISWKAVSGADGYVVYRKNGGSWVRIKTVTDTTYTNGGLNSGTTYQYTVRAYKTVNGKEVLSNGYTVMPVTTMLPKVFSATGNGTGSSAAIRWNAVPGADGYIVYRKNGGSWVRIKSVSGTSYTNGGLTSGKTYAYAVRAYKMVDGKEILSYGYPVILVEIK